VYTVPSLRSAEKLFSAAAMAMKRELSAGPGPRKLPPNGGKPNAVIAPAPSSAAKAYLPAVRLVKPLLVGVLTVSVANCPHDAMLPSSLSAAIAYPLGATVTYPGPSDSGDAPHAATDPSACTAANVLSVAYKCAQPLRVGGPSPAMLPHVFSVPSADSAVNAPLVDASCV
jgi:hypothetical protein